MNRITRTAAAIGVGAIIAIAVPLSASAHVTINPEAASAGSYTVITVKVPNESETAGTSKLELSLPSAKPFASVRYIPVAGWTTELVVEILPEPVTVGDREVTEAVTKVIWTAAPGSEISAGQLQQFPLSVGPVPDTGSIVLAAEQTYTDGEVVSWSEEGEDAEHPAPVLYVNDEPAGDHHGAATVSASNEHANTGDDTGQASPDVLARVLGIAGLVVGAVGIVIGLTSRRRSAA